MDKYSAHTNVQPIESTAIVDGITDWVDKWKDRQWTKSSSEDGANRDLWARRLHLVNKQARKGCEERFWHLSRALNERADRWPKLGAEYSAFHRDLVRGDAAQTEAISLRPQTGFCHRQLQRLSRVCFSPCHDSRLNRPPPSCCTSVMFGPVQISYSGRSEREEMKFAYS